jgi:signal transduction histidine kinase
MPAAFQVKPVLPSAQLRRILEALAQETPAQLVRVYTYYRYQRRLEMAAEYSAAPAAGFDSDHLRLILERRLESTPDAVFPLSPDDLGNTGFQSGLVFRLMMDGELTGLLVLLAAMPDAYRPEHAARAYPWVDMARIIVENKYLHENQAAARAIQAAAHIIGDQPSPQQLINILHDYLCSPQVAMCVLMFYGPQHENRPDGPFDYLEIQGSWLRRYGQGIGVGVRFYLDQYADLLAELDSSRVLTFASVKPLRSRLDPLVRAFIRGERVQSLTLIALHAGNRRLGVIAIATDRPYQFTAQEMDNYRAVSEFLAVGTMARMLQQQHDLVQRARSALLDAVTDGVMMVLPNPLNATVLTVNECFARMFQTSAAAVQGLPLRKLLERLQIPDDVRQELRRRWLSFPFADTAVHRGEFEMVHPDGYHAAITWYSAPVYQENRVMGRIYIFHDVSAERASAALRANFVSWVSHELRTPLTSIRGFAEFILEAAGDQLPDVAREYVEIIHQSAVHLNRVFSDIIEIARADAGQLKLNLVEARLPDILAEVTALLEPQHKTRGQRVVMQCDDDLPAVRADRSRLIQAVTNLLGNAIKYSPENSVIRLTARYVAAREALPAGAPPDVVLPGILVTVTDEGPGIKPEETEQVFLPFFRSQEARAGKIAGTGLGLTIARSFVELHRGKIWAEGRQRGRREGRFLFTLPVSGV